jgi:hypothetical protein
LARTRRPRDIRLSAPSGQRMLQWAAPGNHPARCIYPWLSIRLHPDHRAANRRGRSREPPVFTRFGRTSDETKLARVAGYAPKRLPSRPCQPLGGRGRRRVRGRLMLSNQPFVRLNIIHVANDVIVLHLDSVNLFGVTFDHPFAAHISDNPKD